MLSSKEFVDQIRGAFGDLAGTWRMNDQFYIDPETDDLTLLMRTYSCRLTPSHLLVKCNVRPDDGRCIWSISDTGIGWAGRTLSKARENYLSGQESYCRVVRGDA